MLQMMLYQKTRRKCLRLRNLLWFVEEESLVGGRALPS
jgi:hypothetical protein